jgi:hypothetical protein
MQVTVATNDGSGAGNVAFDATGATVTLHGYRFVDSTGQRDDDQAAWSYAMEVVDGPNGIVQMNWTTSQSAALLAGEHYCWVTVTTPGGAVETFPNTTTGIHLLVLSTP